MNKKLINLLSTGRSGTKFITYFLRDQGYLGFHEELYFGDPQDAILYFNKHLGDLWHNQIEEYFNLYNDNFSYDYNTRYYKPYIDNIKCLSRKNRLLQAISNGNTKNSDIFSSIALKSLIKRILAHPLKSLHFNPDVIIDCNNSLSPAIPLIRKACIEEKIDQVSIVCFRNPIKTIHAIFKIEASAEPCYPHRPGSFHGGDSSIIGAARVWKNTYKMLYDQMERFGKENCMIMELESFTHSHEYQDRIFNFLGLKLNKEKAKRYTDRILGEKLRKEKYDTIRNSDLYADKEFVVNKKDADKICALIQDVACLYNIDLEKSAKEYFDFHQNNKKKIGFG